MADSEDTVTDVSKMKVADLRRELKSRGLSTIGNKNELVERLQGIGVGIVSGEGEDGTGNGTVDTSDGLDDSGNHEESELLDEDDVDDVLEDGLDDAISVEGISETNDGTSIGADENSTLDTSGVAKGPKQASKRKLTSSKKNDSTAQQQQGTPKKITLNRNTSVTISTASEKENQESPDENENKLASTESKDENESSPPKKIVKLSGFSVKERLELRAQKFGVPTPEANAAKREARAIRFGIAAGQSNSSVPVASAELLKKRAERFGTAVSPILKKTEQDEKLKLRQERFNVTSTAIDPQTKAALEEKKRLRAERFKLATAV